MKTNNRAYSTRYEDHVDLMRKLAGRYYRRLLAAGVTSMEFDDVMGEMGLAYTRAAKLYDASRGFTFTAYLGMCCQNQFNMVADKLVREQCGDDEGVGLGLVSLEDMGDGEDPFVECLEGHCYVSPEDAMQAKMVVNGIEQDETLLPETRAYLLHLVGRRPLDEAGRESVAAQGARVRAQIAKRYGVTCLRLGD